MTEYAHPSQQKPARRWLRWGCFLFFVFFLGICGIVLYFLNYINRVEVEEMSSVINIGDDEVRFTERTFRRPRYSLGHVTSFGGDLIRTEDILVLPNSRKVLCNSKEGVFAIVRTDEIWYLIAYEDHAIYSLWQVLEDGSVKSVQIECIPDSALIWKIIKDDPWTVKQKGVPAFTASSRPREFRNSDFRKKDLSGEMRNKYFPTSSLNPSQN